MPTLEQILAGINTARQLIEQYDQIKDTLSSSDRDTVERQLKQLQTSNDALFRKLDTELNRPRSVKSSHGFQSLAPRVLGSFYCARPR